MQFFIAQPKIIINKEENPGSSQCDKQSMVPYMPGQTGRDPRTIPELNFQTAPAWTQSVHECL